MKEIIFKSLKKLWLKGLTTRICMISAAGLVTGSIVTGTVLLSNNNSNPASNTASDKTFHETSHITEESDIFGDNLEANNEQNNSSEELENDTSSDSSTNNHVVSNQTAPKNEKKDDTKQNTESNTNTSQTPESNISKADIERQRKINQAYRDYITVSLPSWSVTVYRFGWMPDHSERICYYEHDPAEYDNGPDIVLKYNSDSGEVYEDGRCQWEWCSNIKYCKETNHYCEQDIFDDGSYLIYVWDETFYCEECKKVFPDNSPHIPDFYFYYNKTEDKFYHRAHEFGDGGPGKDKYHSGALAAEQENTVRQKLKEWFPTKEKVTAPHIYNSENLNKYLPLDDAGIIQQLQNKWY